MTTLDDRDKIAVEAMRGCYPLALLDGLAAEYMKWYGLDADKAFRSIRQDALKRIHKLSEV